MLLQTTDCGATGAICAPDGRELSNGPRATVAGPPVGISVGDARVDEHNGALLAFVASLSRPASEQITVAYATSDGTAQAPVDYTAASGTLTFATGESSKAVSVTVLDDDHDEGEETLTLTRSNASSGQLTDAEATGTIVNRDPLPRALLARFGRTAAVHVVEHVEERLTAPRDPGFRDRFAGRELRRGMEREAALDLLRQLGGTAGAGPLGAGAHGPMSGPPAFGAPGAGGDAGMALAAGPAGPRRTVRRGAGPMETLSGRPAGGAGPAGAAGAGPGQLPGRGCCGRPWGRRAHRIGLLAQPRDARRRTLFLEPGCAVVLRQPRRRPGARRRRAHHDVRGRLRAGPAHHRPVAVAQRAARKLRRGRGRPGGVGGEGLYPSLGYRARTASPLGRGRVRRRGPAPDARGRHRARERPVDGDGGGRARGELVGRFGSLSSTSADLWHQSRCTAVSGHTSRHADQRPGTAPPPYSNTQIGTFFRTTPMNYCNALPHLPKLVPHRLFCPSSGIHHGCSRPALFML